MTTSKQTGRNAPTQRLCPLCDCDPTRAGSTHGVPVVGDTCGECGAAVATNCTVGPGHIVKVCFEGHAEHDVERLVQPCPQCGASMFIAESHPTGRYLYRCGANSEHVKIEATCAEPAPEDESQEGEGAR